MARAKWTGMAKHRKRRSEGSGSGRATGSGGGTAPGPRRVSRCARQPLGACSPGLLDLRPVDGERRGGPAGASGPQPAGSSRVRDGLERNVFVLVVLGVCATVHTQLLRGELASDSWYTLLGGRMIDRTGIPHTDTWTVLTLGRRWVDQQWLAQLGFYRVWSAGGWGLALLSVLVLYLASFAVLAATARRLGASDRATSRSAPSSVTSSASTTAFCARSSPPTCSSRSCSRCS